MNTSREIDCPGVIRAKVINRLKPCNCGCGGKDPWHLSEYVRNITLTTPTEGTIQLPMSTQPVTVRKSPHTGLWFVDRNSIVFDRTEDTHRSIKK